MLSNPLERLSKKKCKNMVTAKKILAITVAVAALIFPKTVGAAASTLDQCAANGDCTISVPVSTATCVLTSSYPDGTSFLSGQVMADTGDGSYKHVFTAPATLGNYKTQACCTSGTNYQCMDKSFEVVATAAQRPTPGVTGAVLGYSTRSLSGFDILLGEVWSYASHILTKSPSVQPVKQLADTSIFEITQDQIPDLGVKMDNSNQVLAQAYIDQQRVLSRIGLVALKWNEMPTDEVITNITEVGKLLGDEKDIIWLKKAWGWSEMEGALGQIQAAKSSLTSIPSLLVTSGKSPAAFNELKSALKNLEAAEALIGNDTNQAGERTAYGQFKQVQGLATAWKDKEVKLSKILENWSDTSETDSIYKEVMTLNQIPKADQVVSNKLKNRILGLQAVVETNQQLLARDQGSILTHTWLEESSITFKTLIVNPSKLISQDALVKYYLPSEVKPENILGHDAGVEVKSDSTKNQLYVEGKITVGAGETQTLQVKVSDIWQITATQIDSLRKQVTELSKPLAKTSYFTQGVTLASDTNASLDKVVSLEKAAVTPQQQIRAFREANVEMANVAEQIAKLQGLATQANSTWPKVVGVGSLIAVVVAGFVFLATHRRTNTIAPVSKIEVQKSYKELFAQKLQPTY